VAGCLEGGRFGESGKTVLMEEHLEGDEVSIMAVCDGRGYVLLASARDYKRSHEGDHGPNTGGMGAFAPAVDRAIADQAGRRIVLPLLTAMSRRGSPFRGTLYAGLMITRDGPRVLEINARFGDPETQAVLPLVEGSFARLLMSAARGDLESQSIQTREAHTVVVALVDEGYPEAVRGGGTLAGLDRAAEAHGVTVFHAGTQWEDGEWKVRGGRAAYVVGSGATREEAKDQAYAAVADVGGEGWRYRTDIAADGVSAGASKPWRRSRAKKTSPSECEFNRSRRRSVANSSSLKAFTTDSCFRPEANSISRNCID